MDSDYLYGDRVSQQPPSMQGGQHLWFSLLLSPEVGQVIIQLASRPSCNKDLLAREILSALIRSDDQLEWVITAPESNQSRHEQVQHSSSITARTALSQGPSHAPSLPMQVSPMWGAYGPMLSNSHSLLSCFSFFVFYLSQSAKPFKAR